MYCFDSRVRYSEINSERTLTLTSLLDYLQDCCTFQSEELGVGIDYLKEHQIAWVLSSWEIVIKNLPKLGEEIRVNTWPYNFKGLYGYRNFSVTDGQGNILAIANSLWVFMNTEKMRPARISEHLIQAYQGEFGEGLKENWGERKIAIPEELEKREPMQVARFHIDTNHHVNNEKYVLVAEEFLPEGFEVGRLRAEYKKAAVLGDVLYPSVAVEKDGVTVVLGNENEQPYAVVWFGKQ